jgi:nitrogenase subunit NifH
MTNADIASFGEKIIALENQIKNDQTRLKLMELTLRTMINTKREEEDAETLAKMKRRRQEELQSNILRIVISIDFKA